VSSHKHIKELDNELLKVNITLIHHLINNYDNNHNVNKYIQKSLAHNQTLPLPSKNTKHKQSFCSKHKGCNHASKDCIALKMTIEQDVISVTKRGIMQMFVPTNKLKRIVPLHLPKLLLLALH
jgi:hypothetical protein